jgi:hypothetical protein
MNKLYILNFIKKYWILIISLCSTIAILTIFFVIFKYTHNNISTDKDRIKSLEQALLQAMAKIKDKENGSPELKKKIEELQSLLCTLQDNNKKQKTTPQKEPTTNKQDTTKLNNLKETQNYKEHDTKNLNPIENNPESTKQNLESKQTVSANKDYFEDPEQSINVFYGKEPINYSDDTTDNNNKPHNKDNDTPQQTQHQTVIINSDNTQKIKELNDKIVAMQANIMRKQMEETQNHCKETVNKSVKTAFRNILRS